MGMRFAKIPKDTFDNLQVETGVLLTNFDPETGEFADEDILTATTGGITVNVKPSFTDYGEDVDNCPNNTKELKIVDEVDVNATTTAININKSNLKYMLAAADEDAQTGKITVRKGMLKASDFKDIWYVGDMANGGFIACHILNALSTDGFSLKTQKKGKGNASLTLTGHFSLDDPDEVPVEFYIGEAEEGSISLTKNVLEMVADDVAVVGISANPKSLFDDMEATVTGTGATAELTTDKKNVIITATGVGTPTVTIASGSISASIGITVTETEGEG